MYSSWKLREGGDPWGLGQILGKLLGAVKFGYS